jgi:hypothetical protein
LLQSGKTPIDAAEKKGHLNCKSLLMGQDVPEDPEV